MYLFIWLCWVFVARGLSLVAVSGGLLFLAVLRLLTVVAPLLRSTSSKPWASVVVALGFSSCSFLAPECRLTHGHSCLAACGIFPEQGLNPHMLNWQADS